MPEAVKNEVKRWKSYIKTADWKRYKLLVIALAQKDTREDHIRQFHIRMGKVLLDGDLPALRNLNDILNNYLSGRPVDIIQLLEHVLDGLEANSQMQSQIYANITSAEMNQKKAGLYRQEQDARYERCFLEIYRRNQKRDYKGTGQGSYLTQLCQNCKMLREIKPATFKKNYARWRKQKMEDPDYDYQKQLDCPLNGDFCNRRSD